MTVRTAVEDELPAARSECWCCGRIEQPLRMVSLGNHPEVTLCTSCARWVAKRAGEVDDLTRTGPLVLLKDRMRLARRRVIERGWHRRAVVGRPLRWLGRLLP